LPARYGVLPQPQGDALDVWRVGNIRDLLVIDGRLNISSGKTVDRQSDIDKIYGIG
jgi:hypothetical protein